MGLRKIQHELQLFQNCLQTNDYITQPRYTNSIFVGLNYVLTEMISLVMKILAEPPDT